MNTQPWCVPDAILSPFGMQNVALVRDDSVPHRGYGCGSVHALRPQPNEKTHQFRIFPQNGSDLFRIMAVSTKCTEGQRVSQFRVYMDSALVLNMDGSMLGSCPYTVDGTLVCPLTNIPTLCNLRTRHCVVEVSFADPCVEAVECRV